MRTKAALELVLCLTLAPSKGGQRILSYSAEDGASGSKGRELSSNSVSLNNASFSEMVHFTKVDLLDLNYSADLHYLERYLFPIHVEFCEHS